MKPKAKDWPQLKKELDDYFGPEFWDKIFDMKSSPTHGYVVIAFPEHEGSEMLDMADLASPNRGQTWEVQNDGYTPITKKDWKKLYCVPDCDWFVIPGNSDYPSMGRED